MADPHDGVAADVSAQQKSALLLLFITFFIDILGVGLVLPLGPYYVQKYPFIFGHRVSPGLAVGALTACYPILQLICAPFWGKLSDRVGRRPIILMSLLGNAIAWCLFGVARSLAMLFIARSFSGVFSSASLPTVQAYIADSTPPQKRSVWIGIVVGMGFSFGFILGPPIGGILGQRNLSYPAFLAAGIAVLNFLVAYVRLPESLSASLRARAAQFSHRVSLSEFTQAFTDPRIGVLLLILLLSTFAMQSLEQNVTLYGNKDVTRSETLNGWSDVTSKFLKNQAVYELSYAPGNPPPPAVHTTILHTLASESTVSPEAFPPEAIREDSGVNGGQIHVLRHLVQEDTGLVLMAVALVVGFVQGGALKRLVPRFGEPLLIFAGGLIATLGFALVPFAHSFWTLILVACIVAFGFSFISPCLRGLVSRDTEAHRQGSIGGITESVRSFAMAAGPLAGGWLFDLGHALPFWLGAACMFAAGLVVLTLRGDSQSTVGLFSDPVEPY